MGILKLTLDTLQNFLGYRIYITHVTKHPIVSYFTSIRVNLHTSKMRTSLFLLLGANDSVPIVNNNNNSNTIVRARRGGDDTYGSWDWFINQIKTDNAEAKPTDSVPKTRQPVRQQRQPSGQGTGRRVLPATSGISTGRVRSQRFIPSNQPLGAHGSEDDDRFNWFGKAKEAPVMLS